MLDIRLGPTGQFQAAVPKPLFAPRGSIRDYAATADGQKFLINLFVQQQGQVNAPITVVQNWMAGVKK